jgi:hypothetical protein
MKKAKENAISMYIPEYLKDKELPSDNKNALYKLSKLYNYRYFKEIEFDVVKTIYNNNKNLFWDIIRLVAFYGVKFKGELAKYNYIKKENDNPKLLLVNKDFNSFINYEVFNSSLKPKLISFGLVKKRNVDKVTFEALLSLTSREKSSIEKFVNKNNLKIISLTEYYNLEKEEGNKRGRQINIKNPNYFNSDLNDKFYSIELLLNEIQEMNINKIIKNIYKMVAKEVKPGIIMVLHKANGLPGQREQLKDFILELKSLGINGGRLNLAEIDDRDVKKRLELSPKEASD